MYITEAIRKKFLVIVINNEKAKELKQLYKYDNIKSYRSIKRIDGVSKPVWIDSDVILESSDMNRLEQISMGQVYYGDSQDNEAVDILNQYEELIAGQNKTITSAIELRIFSSFIQKFLQELEHANPSLGLTDTINNLVKLHNNFDKAAIEYGPYQKEEYISAVLAPHFDKQ